MKCENCGAPISKNDNYCPYCGCKNTDFDSSIKSNDVVAKKSISPIKKLKRNMVIYDLVVILCFAIAYISTPYWVVVLPLYFTPVFRLAIVFHVLNAFFFIILKNPKTIPLVRLIVDMVLILLPLPFILPHYRLYDEFYLVGAIWFTLRLIFNVIILISQLVKKRLAKVN